MLFSARAVRSRLLLATVASMLLLGPGLSSPAVLASSLGSIPVVETSVPDPDAAAGLDNFNWSPAPGTLRSQGVAFGRPVPVPLAGSEARPQGAPEEGARMVDAYCPPQAAEGRKIAEVQSCFHIWSD